MAYPLFPDHRPSNIPLIYDLGAHTLTIEGEQITLTDKVNADTTMQEISLSEQEAYRLLVTLQTLFQ
jgi:hypothetical protein